MAFFSKNRNVSRTARKARLSFAPGVDSLDRRRLLTGGPDITFYTAGHWFAVTGTPGNDTVQLSVDNKNNSDPLDDQVVCSLTAGGTTQTVKVPRFKDGKENVTDLTVIGMGGQDVVVDRLGVTDSVYGADGFIQPANPDVPGNTDFAHDALYVNRDTGCLAIGVTDQDGATSVTPTTIGLVPAITAFSIHGQDSLKLTTLKSVLTANGLVPSVTSVRFRGGDGNDSFNNDTELPTDARGGKGTDFLMGGSGPDRLYGDEGNDTVLGQRGDDVVYGGDGDDVVQGGDGDDHAYGEAGRDTMFGGAGNDWIFGGLPELSTDGDDSIYGGDGDDMIYGNHGSDALYGGNGSDTIYGDDLADDKGNDTIDGGDGDDWLYGEAGTNVIHGGNGDDWIFVGTDDPNLAKTSMSFVYGDAGNDSLANHHGYAWLYGGADNDYLMAGDSPTAAYLYGEGGDDYLVANSMGKAVMSGGEGNDWLCGGPANDTLNGDGGDDLLMGGDGQDVLNGGLDNDILIGGKCNAPDDGVADVLTGGGGADTFELELVNGTNIDAPTDLTPAAGDAVVDGVDWIVFFSPGHWNGPVKPKGLMS